MLEATPVARVGAVLGEGPVWVERANSDGGALWFVDIKSRRAHRFDPASGRVEQWDAPGEIGWVLPAADGGFIAGLHDGLHRFAPASGFAHLLHVEPDLPGNRLNDAATDPAGRIWFGSMDNAESSATGRLYVFDGRTARDGGAAPVTITNGPAISPDGRTLYAVDTLGRNVDAYSLGEDGMLGDPRRFLTIPPDQGHPDGATCDAEGGVWLGFFGGWTARRYAPDGEVTHEVRFPTANITKVAIGGPDGRTAYATSARMGLDAAALAAQPQAGDLFTFPAPFPGAPVTPAVVR